MDSRGTEKSTFRRGRNDRNKNRKKKKKQPGKNGPQTFQRLKESKWMKRVFPSGPVTKDPTLPMPGARVRSLVREPDPTCGN